MTTVTGSDLRTPDEVAETILLIGRVSRSTGHVRVGLGAARQDLNVSVRGGRRVEIKGVPQAGWARRLVHGETLRQLNLLRLRDELHRRGITRPGDLLAEHHDVTDLFAGSTLPLLRADSWQRFLEEEGRRPGLELGAGPFCVRAVRLHRLAETLSWPTQPGRTFAHELAGRVRVIAGLDQPPILLSGEQWPPSPDAGQELERLRKRLGCGPEDALVVVWGPLEDTVTAVDEIRQRCVDALDGVPAEARRPFCDGSTDFERVLPDEVRSVPDTGCPPQPITRDQVRVLRLTLAEPPWLREERYRAARVPDGTIHFLVRRDGARLVDRVVFAAKADLRQACFFFGERLKGFRRAGVPVERITVDRWVEMFRLLREQPILWETWKQLVIEIALRPTAPVYSLAAALLLKDGFGGWRDRVMQLVATARPSHPDGTREQLVRFLLGKAMRKLRGRVPVVEVRAAIEAELGVTP